MGRKHKDWEVDRGSFVKVEKLGSGEFGEVWQGVLNGVEVAIKEFKGKMDNISSLRLANATLRPVPFHVPEVRPEAFLCGSPASFPSKEARYPERD